MKLIKEIPRDPFKYQPKSCQDALSPWHVRIRPANKSAERAIKKAAIIAADHQSPSSLVYFIDESELSYMLAGHVEVFGLQNSNGASLSSGAELLGYAELDDAVTEIVGKLIETTKFYMARNSDVLKNSESPGGTSQPPAINDPTATADDTRVKA